MLKPQKKWKIYSAVLVVCFSLLAYAFQVFEFSYASTSNTKDSNEEYDALEPDVDSYYQNALNKKGTDLRKALYEIISHKHKKVSYTKVWAYLDELDEDPQNPENLILIYTGRSHPKKQKAKRGDKTQSDYWTREHIWPQSHGLKTKHKKKTAHTDLHHIFPADKTVNSARGKKVFDDGGNPHREASQNKSDKNSWEPRSEVKGDIARALFYMDLRYEGGKEEDLQLIDSDKTSGTQFGKLCTLYQWHLNDPVSEPEKARNNKIHSIQGNRNPFIDHPEWVQDLWSTSCSQKNETHNTQKTNARSKTSKAKAQKPTN